VCELNITPIFCFEHRVACIEQNARATAGLFTPRKNRDTCKRRKITHAKGAGGQRLELLPKRGVKLPEIGEKVLRKQLAVKHLCND
jgi:hypothetical protein